MQILFKIRKIWDFTTNLMFSYIKPNLIKINEKVFKNKPICKDL